MESCGIVVHAQPLAQNRLAYSNLAYVNEDDFRCLLRCGDVAGLAATAVPVCFRNAVFHVTPRASVDKGTVQLSSLQRKAAGLAFTDPVPLVAAPPCLPLATVTLTVEVLQKQASALRVNATQLAARIVEEYNGQVFRVGQEFCILASSGQALKLGVIAMAHIDMALGVGAGAGDAASSSAPRFGAMDKATTVGLQAHNALVEIVGGSKTSTKLFDPSFNFQHLGIGGLDKEFSVIFRRAFASRLYPGLMREFGLQHVRGILLYGPPGCGKTLIARKIGEALHTREPKKVNGPEILNKYVGQSEENIRALFKDAEEEQKARGDDSDLHIIIFDEIDAICKQRGSTRDGTGVGDNIVNQLLTKLDGLDGLNNILVIGMTNRRDLIDEALTRPGRMEICLEIGLPDQEGRVCILDIHTAKIRAAGRLEEDVDLERIAAQAKNFTGAELMGLVRDATTFAMQKAADPSAPTRAADPDAIKLSMGDFEHALAETTPQFGTKEHELTECFRNGIIAYGTRFAELMQQLSLFTKQVVFSERTPLLSVLLYGRAGCGKTAISAKTAMDSPFTFKKRISAEMLLGYSEAQKAGVIQRVFEDAYKTDMSCIILDDIERLIDYVALGQRFCNTVLQALLVLVKRPPPASRKVFIIATTSNLPILEEMGIAEAFNVSLEVPLVSTPTEVQEVLTHLTNVATQRYFASSIRGQVSIKKLLLAVEMAQLSGDVTETSCAQALLMCDVDTAI